MIRPLLILAALGVSLAGEAALPLTEKSDKFTESFKNPAFQVSTSRTKAVSRSSAETFDYSYCGDPYTAYSLGSSTYGKTVRQCVAVPQFVASAYAGDTIKSIIFSQPTNRNSVNTVKTATVFIMEDLNSEPVYVQDVTMTTSGFGMRKVQLTTPYVITGEKPLYFGYEFKAPNSDYFPFVVDGMASFFDFAGYYSVEGSNWAPMGMNLVIRAELKGDVLPEAIGMPVAVSSPKILLNTESDISFKVFNFAYQDIENSEIEYSLTGNTVSAEVSTDPFGLCQYGDFTLSVVGEEEGFAQPITIKLIKLNGKELDQIPSEYKEITSSLSVVSQLFERSLVLEEATGTWCGWCPRGYVALENARERYVGTGKVIPIAVHTGDAMQVSSYSGWLNKYIESLPSFMANRIDGEVLDFSNNAEANDVMIDELYEQISSLGAFTDVDFEVDKLSDTQIEVNIKTYFALDLDDNPFALSILVKEDSVGPYKQTSYFTSIPGFGDFSKSSSVTCYYNDVARNIDTWDGITSSLPKSVTASESYNYTRRVSINTVKNKKKFDVVVMVINKVTGEIDNARTFTYDSLSFIDAVQTESEVYVKVTENAIQISGDYDSASVYTVDGRLVKSVSGVSEIAVAPGLYIVKAGTTVAKVNVR